MRTFFDFRATGVSEPEHFGHFIECFAGSIIDRAPDQLVVGQAIHSKQHRVSTAHNK